MTKNAPAVPASTLPMGPQNLFAQQLHGEKYREEGETFVGYATRWSTATADGAEHQSRVFDMLAHQRFLPAGRQQRAVGTSHKITAFNCFVSSPIQDDMDNIMETLKRGATTMRAGGGKGWDFSPLRPAGTPVKGLGAGAFASGPVSFMGMWDAMCKTIMSGGGRRGAMMAVLRVDHPDVRQFINSKRTPADVQPLWDVVERMPEGADRTAAVWALQKTLKLTSFNISLGITDEFMHAVKNDLPFDLRFGGKVYETVSAKGLWFEIMSSNWDWAEPGVLFIDRINKMNPLWYCEVIAATNPCAEQPLPPDGACLLGSFNMIKYLVKRESFDIVTGGDQPTNRKQYWAIDYDLLRQDVTDGVRAVDNVIDVTIYPLPEQQTEAYNKRRMGLGYTAMANLLETMGFPYGTPEYIAELEKVANFMTNTAYRASIALAAEKGSFPLFDAELWLQSGFAQSGVLADDVIEGIRTIGLRNGLLMSIAPTGTISLCADNVSSAGEPVFRAEQSRLVTMQDGQITVDLNDYAYDKYGTVPRTADQVTPQEHIDTLCAMQRHTDSAVSKTCNVTGQVNGQGSGITFEEFAELYMRAYDGGAKGCTTFNDSGKRMGILSAKKTKVDEATDEEVETVVVAATGTNDGAACVFDPATGLRTCE
jgi:ribonucleoside-diphosphate reductase alpha chain